MIFDIFENSYQNNIKTKEMVKNLESLKFCNQKAIETEIICANINEKIKNLNLEIYKYSSESISDILINKF